MQQSHQSEPIRAPEQPVRRAAQWQAQQGTRVTITYYPGLNYPWVARADSKGLHVVLMHKAAPYIRKQATFGPLTRLMKRLKRAVTKLRKQRLQREYDEEHGPVQYTRTRARHRPDRIRPGFADKLKEPADPDVEVHAQPQKQGSIVAWWRGDQPDFVQLWNPPTHS